MRRLALALLLSLAACGARPPRARVPDHVADPASDRALVEDALGKLSDAVFSGQQGVYEDPALAAYVGEVGARVAAHAGFPDRRWSFHVTDDIEVNAYGIVGGHAYVTRGMLAILDSEAELAAVLAHEIAHVGAGHGMHTLSDLAAGGRLAEDPNEAESGRDQEYQADQLGVRTLAAAGYDPRAFLSMLRAIYGWELGVVHATPLRVRLARAALVMGDRGPGGAGEIARERYLQHLDGLVLGPDPRAGHVDGERFVDEQRGFAFTIPAGLIAAVKERTFAATDATGKMGVVLSPVAPRGTLIHDAWVEGMKQVAPLELRPVTGGSALVGQRDGMWMAMVTIGDHSHVLATTAPDAAAARRLLDTALASYSGLEARDRRAPRRLRIAVADHAAPIRDLLGPGCGEGDLGTSLRLHGLTAERVLHAGERFKCAPR